MRIILASLIALTSFSAKAATSTTSMQVRLTVVDTCTTSSNAGRVLVNCAGGSQVNISTQPVSSTTINDGRMTVITY
jgi:hypothetical protein